MKTPSAMSDAELDEAVARECFGWNRDVPSAARLSIMEFRWKYGPGEGGPWHPTTDARDAERVWDWLLERSDIGVEVWRSKRPSFYNLEKPDSVSIDPGHDEEPFLYADGWKRAVCLAALAVARKDL